MSENKLSLGQVYKLHQQIKSKMERLERDVGSLKDILNIHDNWHSTIRKWLGEEVTIKDLTGEESSGILKWSDRYNICVELKDRTRMYTKGGIALIDRLNK